MLNLRPSAWALTAVLVAGLGVSAGPSVALASTPPPVCTGWTDEYHPPDTIRVLRSKGPSAGQVQVVNFWDYVAVVLRAEYSTGANKPPLWMDIGAITVKQYGWFYAMHWRGGKITLPDGSTQCYDVKDTTADQIYKPQETWPDGTIFVGNVPTPANYQAMRATWNITLRKWVVKKSKSRLFLTGYRSGKKKPCGSDSTGFKIFQKSLRDCGVKGLTVEEVLREYFEPKLQIVDARTQDVLSDGDSWFGDLGVLVPVNGRTQWRLYAGTDSGFDAAQTGSLNVDPTTILGQGSGDVTGADPNGAADGRLLRDLILLRSTGGSGRQLVVVPANGSGYDSPTTVAAPDGVTQLLVADFNGDGLADAGLLGPAAGQTKLSVMLGQGNDGFGPATDWWTGALDLANDVALAGDVNGDGKADLIVRSAATGSYTAALSRPSCSDLSIWGPCPTGAIGVPGLADMVTMLDTSSWTKVDSAVSDYDRDGRDDVVAVVQDGNALKVFGLRSKPGGGFADPQLLWQQASTSIDNVIPVGMNVNPDGLGDLALLQKNNSTTSVYWLRSIEASKSGPATMTLAGTPLSDSNLTWGTSIKTY